MLDKLLCAINEAAKLEQELNRLKKERHELYVLLWLLIRKMGGTVTIFQLEMVELPDSRRLDIRVCPNPCNDSVTYHAVVAE